MIASSFSPSMPDLSKSPTIDQVGVEERVERLTKRSIKKASKVDALKLALSMIDLTTLEGADSPGKVRQMCYKAAHLHDSLPDIPHVAAVCVYPTLVKLAKAARQPAPASKSPPSRRVSRRGQYPLDVKLRDTKHAVDEGADEIDMVISRGHFLSGDYNYVFDEIAQVKEACGSAHLKVILETGELGSYDQVRQASATSPCTPAADFIKTSTGKVTPAATLPVTLVMLEAIRDFYYADRQEDRHETGRRHRDREIAINYLVVLRETLGEAWMTPDCSASAPRAWPTTS